MIYIKKEDVAKILGIKPGTILKMAQANQLPHYKFGFRSLRFREDEIIKWAESKKVTPINRPASLLQRRLGN